MRYAINHWVYADEPLKVSFERLKRFGYDGIELKGEPAIYPVSEIKALCEKFELVVTSVLGWSIWGIPGRDLSSPDEKERAAAIQYGQQCIDFAAAVGAPLLIVLPVPAGRTAPIGNPDTETGWITCSKLEWDLAVDSVRQTAIYAAKRGLVLAVEPINRYETYMITTVDDAMQFVADVGEKNVKLNLDTFHMNIDEPDPAAAILKAGKALAHMHVADSNRQSPGRGHTDFATIFRALHEIDFQGTLALEPVPPGANPGLAVKMSQHIHLRDVYARESIQYLKQIETAMETK